jgi:hypothetical protein
MLLPKALVPEVLVAALLVRFPQLLDRLKIKPIITTMKIVGFTLPDKCSVYAFR